MINPKRALAHHPFANTIVSILIGALLSGLIGLWIAQHYFKIQRDLAREQNTDLAQKNHELVRKNEELMKQVKRNEEIIMEIYEKTSAMKRESDNSCEHIFCVTGRLLGLL